MNQKQINEDLFQQLRESAELDRHRAELKEAAAAGNTIQVMTAFPGKPATWSDLWDQASMIDLIDSGRCTFRIKPEPEEWAAEKEAFKAGKKIEFRYANNNGQGCWSEWRTTAHPEWFIRFGSYAYEYRVAPEPWAEEKAAFKAGKKIWVRRKFKTYDKYGNWEGTSSPLWLTEDDGWSFEYSAAPDLSTKPEDLPSPCWVRLNDMDQLVIGFSIDDMTLSRGARYSIRELKDIGATYSDRPFSGKWKKFN